MEGANRRISELRERAGLSQSQLAAAAGLSREQLNRIERGARTLAHAEAVDLALALGVGIEDLSPSAHELVQFRGNTETDGAQEAIRLFRMFVHNWQAIDVVQSLDRGRRLGQ